MDGSRLHPDLSKINPSSAEQRLAYLFAVAACNGSFNYPVFASTKASSTEIVCANFERMDKVEVTESSFQYHLETAVWKGLFSHLGDNAPDCPWTVDDFHDDVDSFSNTYRQWRIHHALPVPISSSNGESSTEDSAAAQEMNLDSNVAGEENSELRRVNSILQRENEDLRRAMAEGSDLAVSAPEDPVVLRETAFRLASERVPCEFATAVKYISFMPPGTHLSCKGVSCRVGSTIRGFDGMTTAEAELRLNGYLMAHENYLGDGPVEFRFALNSYVTGT
ncbi:hypothetical protein FMUND_13621 [Fusarium mundagurra]|uniref:Uncharacterized protein n=1 Tax=Fusarium mundagurra TaxID=1567541 RepID=A0A8H5XZ47_9HYPO|nr:hypothetical protein FMUND_13621 [Fusarium mundagurra]